MFAATVINFLLFSLGTGAAIYTLIVLIRKPLIQDIDSPLTEAGIGDLVNNTLRNANLISLWAGAIPVSTKLSLDPVFIHP